MSVKYATANITQAISLTFKYCMFNFNDIVYVKMMNMQNIFANI